MNTPEHVSQTLSGVVASAISAAGLSQRAAAEASGIPLVTLNRKLTHRSAFNAVELAAISSVVGVSLTELALRTERALTTAA